MPTYIPAYDASDEEWNAFFDPLGELVVAAKISRDEFPSWVVGPAIRWLEHKRREEASFSRDTTSQQASAATRAALAAERSATAAETANTKAMAALILAAAALSVSIIG